MRPRIGGYPIVFLVIDLKHPFAVIARDLQFMVVIFAVVLVYGGQSSGLRQTFNPFFMKFLLLFHRTYLPDIRNFIENINQIT